jgi:hypothetical protein
MKNDVSIDILCAPKTLCAKINIMLFGVHLIHITHFGDMANKTSAQTYGLQICVRI